MHEGSLKGTQAKLAVSQPGDRQEREADRIADRVMRVATPQVRPDSGPISNDLEPPVQRQSSGLQDGEEEGLLRAEGIPARGPDVAAGAEQNVQQALSGGGKPLKPDTRSSMEARFGHDFSRVRVHDGSRAAESARRVEARAYTLGQDIVFAAGRYAPQTAGGERLLAHELTHVVQQQAGRQPRTILRTCSPPQERANEDPNEGQKPGVFQMPADPCVWLLLGFPIGSTEFMFAHTPAVNQLNRYLADNPSARLELQGLNDCFGTDKINIAIGTARSGNVLNAFTSGVHKQIDVAPSDGRTYAVPNDTPIRRSINRSVRVVVTPAVGGLCPMQVGLGKQLDPGVARGNCGGDEGELLMATKGAVPIAITALSRVRNWRQNPTTASLLDIYYGTTSDAERDTASISVINGLQSIIPRLQKPLVDCSLPGDPIYKKVCPDNTIADARGGSGILIPTFCFPQFMTLLKSTDSRSITVIHEFGHRYAGTRDHGAYYSTDTCFPTTSTEALSVKQRLDHADTFACFVGQTALRGP